MDKLSELNCNDSFRTSVSKQELSDLFERLGNEWQIKNGILLKAYGHKNFKAGIAFTNIISAIAEAQNHHPEIRLCFTSVTIELHPNANNSLTQCDFIFASIIEKALELMGSKNEKRINF